MPDIHVQHDKTTAPFHTYCRQLLVRWNIKTAPSKRVAIVGHSCFINSDECVTKSQCDTCKCQMIWYLHWYWYETNIGSLIKMSVYSTNTFLKILCCPMPILNVMANWNLMSSLPEQQAWAHGIVSTQFLAKWVRGPWVSIKMLEYRNPYWGDKTVVRSSYLHNWSFYTGKMAHLYWIRPSGSFVYQITVYQALSEIYIDKSL